MHPWVAILGFLLFLPDGVTSYRQVIGGVGQSVTLPCFSEGEVTSMCWGRGKCSWIDCRNTVIRTDGYKVTEQKSERYKLKGDIGKRDVSLTIENAVLSDSGLYCCRIKKWLFNDEENIIKLTMKSAPPTTTVSPTTTSESTSTTSIPRTTYTTPPTRNTTIPERTSTTIVVMDTHMTMGASTSALPRPTPTADHKPASPMTTVNPNITAESTRTRISNIPRTTYTTPPTRNTTIPERTSTTIVVTDTHTTTGASTSALPRPTPTADHKPASPMTTVNPNITAESTRTRISNIPRTTYTTPPTRNTTIPERTSTTIVVTDTHTTTGASTSALPRPTPTADHKPASSSSPRQTTGTRSTCHKTNVTHLPWRSSTTAGGNDTVTNFPSAACCSVQTGIYIGIAVIVLVLLLMVLVFMISKRSVCLGNKMRLLCMIPLKDSHIGALKNAAMKPVRAEDNIYVMDDGL